MIDYDKIVKAWDEGRCEVIKYPISINTMMFNGCMEIRVGFFDRCVVMKSLIDGWDELPVKLKERLGDNHYTVSIKMHYMYESSCLELFNRMDGVEVVSGPMGGLTLNGEPWDGEFIEI